MTTEGAEDAGAEGSPGARSRIATASQQQQPAAAAAAVATAPLVGNAYFCDRGRAPKSAPAPQMTDKVQITSLSPFN